jgi:hypothetical protein
MSYWRRQAIPIIRRVIEEVGRDDERALRKALAEAYPFGPRAYHPYKIWLDEIKKQLQGPKPRDSFAPRPPRPDPVSPGQMSLLPPQP